MDPSQKTAWLSIATNMLLVAIKTSIALISGSLAVAADAIHSLSDVVSSAIILLGIKIADRPARGFPYGLYKVENLVAMGTSILILFAGYEIIKTVFGGGGPAIPRQLPLAITGVSLTIVITWLFSRYELKKGHETGSPSLIADARHIWSDMLSSLVILTALLGSALGLAIDKYAAVIVVFFIARSAIIILLDSVRVLLDASLNYQSLTRIREIVLADTRVAAINNIWARNAGRYKFVELDLILRVKELEKGHQVAKEIENRVKRELGQVDRVLIHAQPRQGELLTMAIPLNPDQETISDHFGEAPFFRLVRLQRRSGHIVEEELLANPYLEEEKAKGIKVAKWLLEKGLEVLISRHDQADKGPGFVLGNGGAEILVTEEKSASRALNQAGKVNSST
ncbi:MAG: cation transporter [Desulfobulbaceae bacterium]|mgnify:CR=1 FL=1|nr:MAG: cation transporter [Desulfobulbaceae bacterium]